MEKAKLNLDKKTSGVGNFVYRIQSKRLPLGWTRLVYKGAGPKTLTLCLHQKFAGTRETHKTPLCMMLKNRRGEILYKFPENLVGLTISSKVELKVNRIRWQQYSTIEAALRLVLRSLKENPWRSVDIAKNLWDRDKDAVKRLITKSSKATYTPQSYAEWADYFVEPDEIDLQRMRDKMKSFAKKPCFHIFVPVGRRNSQFVRATLNSLKLQVYPNWKAWLLAPDTNHDLSHYTEEDKRIVRFSSAEFKPKENDFILRLEIGSQIRPHALFLTASRATQNNKLSALYSDFDEEDRTRKTHSPCFKTAWDWDKLLSGDWHFRYLAIRASALPKKMPVNSQEEWFTNFLSLMESIDHKKVEHLPYVLLKYPTELKADPPVKLIAKFLEGSSLKARFSHKEGFQYPLPSKLPSVTCVIPTKDRLDLLAPLVKELITKTDYPNLRILIVNNQSREPETFDYFNHIASKHGAKIVDFDRPYNFSLINNFGVANANSEFVALLNNDLRIIHKDWLKQMVRHGVRPDVGAVGAKLLFPDGSVQHAGVVLGISGSAGHIERFSEATEPDKWGFKSRTQSLSAVTAACLLLRKDVYEEVGGMEPKLAVDYQDIDLCMAIRNKGYKVIYTPDARLYHLESKTRGTAKKGAVLKTWQKELNFFRKKWAGSLEMDPHYSPNLGLLHEQASLASPPRTPQPWA